MADTVHDGLVVVGVRHAICRHSDDQCSLLYMCGAGTWMIKTAGKVIFTCGVSWSDCQHSSLCVVTIVTQSIPCLTKAWRCQSVTPNAMYITSPCFIDWFCAKQFITLKRHPRSHMNMRNCIDYVVQSWSCFPCGRQKPFSGSYYRSCALILTLPFHSPVAPFTNMV